MKRQWVNGQGYLKGPFLPPPTLGKGEKVGSPPTPPRGGSPLEPCLAQLLNGPAKWGIQGYLKVHFFPSPPLEKGGKVGNGSPPGFLAPHPAKELPCRVPQTLCPLDPCFAQLLNSPGGIGVCKLLLLSSALRRRLQQQPCLVRCGYPAQHKAGR